MLIFNSFLFIFDSHLAIFTTFQSRFTGDFGAFGISV